MLDPLGLAIGCMPLVGPKSPAGSHEIQQVTYSADVGLWKIKSDGGALPFDVDALSLATEISVAHGYECTVSVAVAGSNRSYTITFAAMGPVPLLAPVNESLQTSASASPNLSVTTQGAEAQVATHEVVSIAGSGLGDETIDNHGNRGYVIRRWFVSRLVGRWSRMDFRVSRRNVSYVYSGRCRKRGDIQGVWRR